MLTFFNVHDIIAEEKKKKKEHHNYINKNLHFK